MTTPTVNKTQEVTLTIESSPLAPGGTTSVTTQASNTNHSYWTITLTRITDTLKVGVNWYRHSSYPLYLESNVYQAMHLVPHERPHDFTSTNVNASSLQGQAIVEGTIGVDKVLKNNKYCFDIIMSTSQSLLRKPNEPNNSNNRGDLLLVLLKDVHSVDTCFVFESDKSYANVGLWAHRAILSSYKPFANLIMQTSASASSSSSSSSVETKPPATSAANVASDPNLTINEDQSVPSTFSSHNGTSNVNNSSGVLTISVEKFSLATFCVLLRFIYTGEIDLSADLGLHAISTAGSSKLVLQGINGKKQELDHWSPLDLASPWKFKDVTWEELLLVADYFGVEELRTRCEEAVIATMDASNAVETLFGVGSCFDKVKEAALNYIVTNMASITKEGKDKTFAPYKDHPYCVDMMFEIMERRAAKH